jgi:hypothetical protein
MRQGAVHYVTVAESVEGRWIRRSRKLKQAFMIVSCDAHNRSADHDYVWVIPIAESNDAVDPELLRHTRKTDLGEQKWASGDAIDPANLERIVEHLVFGFVGRASSSNPNPDVAQGAVYVHDAAPFVIASGSGFNTDSSVVWAAPLAEDGAIHAGRIVPLPKSELGVPAAAVTQANINRIIETGHRILTGKPPARN